MSPPNCEEKAPKVDNHQSFHDGFNLSESNNQLLPHAYTAGHSSSIPISPHTSAHAEPSPQAHRVTNPPLPITNMPSNPEVPSSPARRITDHPPIPIISGTSHTELYFQLPCQITNPHLFATTINYITGIGLNGHDVSWLTKVIQSIRSDDGLLFINTLSRLELATLVSVINQGLQSLRACGGAPFKSTTLVGGMMCQPPNMARALGLYDLRFIAVTTPSPVSISSSPHASVPSHP